MDSLRSRLRALRSCARRRERREMRAFRQWLEHTSNLLHLSVLVFVPLVIGVITYVFNRADVLPFLLFPPLASGTYALFVEPEGRYANPWKFVAGMTAGAVCGWIALSLAGSLYEVPAGPYTTHAGAAAFGVFLTGVVTWAFDIEHPTAFSTALLVLVVGSSQLEYVASVALSSTVVAAVFWGWRREFYEQRGEYLYQSTKGDDHVLVPMRGEYRLATALLGARLAAAHDAGKVVLLDVVGDDEVALAERELMDESAREATADLTADGGGQATGTERTPGSDDGANGDEVHETAETDGTDDEGNEAIDEETIADALARDRKRDPSLRERAVSHVARRAAEGLEDCAARIEREMSVPCEVVVVAGDDGATLVTDTAHAENCDLIVAPYEADEADETDETDGDGVSAFVDGLLGSDIDTLVHRSDTGCTEWNRIMVPVRGASAISHAMIDFAERLAGENCAVSVCHCVSDEGDRRAAERMLSDLVETCRGDVETRVARARIEAFLRAHAPEYDLIIVGASTDRSAASRLLSPPTFERLDDLSTDVAIIHG